MQCSPASKAKAQTDTLPESDEARRTLLPPSDRKSQGGDARGGTCQSGSFESSCGVVKQSAGLGIFAQLAYAFDQLQAITKRDGLSVYSQVVCALLVSA